MFQESNVICLACGRVSYQQEFTSGVALCLPQTAERCEGSLAVSCMGHTCGCRVSGEVVQADIQGEIKMVCIFLEQVLLASSEL